MRPLLGGVRTLSLDGVLNITPGGVLYTVLAGPPATIAPVSP